MLYSFFDRPNYSYRKLVVKKFGIEIGIGCRDAADYFFGCLVGYESNGIVLSSVNEKCL